MSHQVPIFYLLHYWALHDKFLFGRTYFRRVVVGGEGHELAELQLGVRGKRLFESAVPKNPKTKVSDC